MTVQFKFGFTSALHLPRNSPRRGRSQTRWQAPLRFHEEVATMTVFLLRSRSGSVPAEIPGSLSSSSLPPSFTPGRCAADLLPAGGC